MKLLQLLFEQIIQNYLIDNFNEYTGGNLVNKILQGIQGLTFSLGDSLELQHSFPNPKIE